MSVNGLQSFMHVFDKTTFKPDSQMGMRGFLAVKISDIPAESEMEIYMTDSANVVIDQGRIMKGKIKGPAAQIVLRVSVPVKDAGTYIVWGRMDSGEPMRLLTWGAEVKA